MPPADAQQLFVEQEARTFAEVELTAAAGVRVGVRCGRKDLSASPAVLSSRSRRTHVQTVCRLTPSCLATSPGMWP